MMTRSIRRSGTVLALAWLGGWLGAAPAQGAPLGPAGEAARRDGNAMYDAFRRGRLEEFVAFAYPAVVQEMGGKEKMVAVLKKGLAEMATQGFRFVSGRVSGPIQVVRAKGELHALVPLTQILSAPGGELHLAGHMLGVSSNNGQSWTFIDAGTLTPDNVRQLLPSFNPELKLPPKAEPRFVPKK
jgi:hypothetical protein